MTPNAQKIGERLGVTRRPKTYYRMSDGALAIDVSFDVKRAVSPERGWRDAYDGTRGFREAASGAAGMSDHEQIVPRSLDEAKAEYREMVTVAQEIDSQLSNADRSRDLDWRRRAIWRKTIAMTRARYLRDWIKAINTKVAQRETAFASDGDIVSDPVALVARLRRELLTAYRDRFVTDGAREVLDAASHYVRLNAEAEVFTDLEMGA
jgi:hypothetical protein